MTRYQALRKLCGCDPLTAGVIVAMNTLLGTPPGTVVFMHLVIEFDPEARP